MAVFLEVDKPFAISSHSHLTNNFKKLYINRQIAYTGYCLKLQLHPDSSSHKTGVTMSPVRVTDMRLGNWDWLRKNLLLILTFTGVLVGATLGFGLRAVSPNDITILLISYPGELFIRMLKLMILPLIIASLISGSASLNAKMSGRIVYRTVLYFLATSLLNAILGVVLCIVIHPGSPVTKQALEGELNSKQVTGNSNILDGFLDLGRNLFPDNIFQATFQQVYTGYTEKQVLVKEENDNSTDLENLVYTTVMVPQVRYRAGTNTLGIIVFCLVFGSILGSLGKKGTVVVEFFAVIDMVILKIVTGIMWLSPLGVASVIMSKILSVDNLGTVMSNLGLFIVTVVIGVFIWQWLIQSLLYFIFTQRNPLNFYFHLLEPWVTAFATASTAATLPITFRCMNDKCGVDARISRFVLPIGATVNMDGTALFVSVGTIFIAQMNEIELSIGEYVTIAITATAASVASASVPSAALVLILIVLTTVNLPAGDVSLLFTIDWLVDRFRTTNNMLGDCYSAAIVAHWSKGDLKAMDMDIGQDPTVASQYHEDPEKPADLTPLVTRNHHINEAHLQAPPALLKGMDSPVKDSPVINSAMINKPVLTSTEIRVEVETIPEDKTTNI